MGRSTSLMGLSPRAERFLAQNTKMDAVEIIRGGIRYKSWEEPAQVEGDFYYTDPFGEDNNLLPGYVLKDGSIVFEKVQVDPWAGGPCIFTTLVCTEGTVELPKDLDWTEDEISNSI